MKLLTIDSREVTGRPGVLLDSGDILDLAVAPSSLSESQWIPHSIVSVLAAGRNGLENVERLIAAAGKADRQRLLSEGALLPYSGTALLAPVRRPGLVLIVDAHDSGYIKSPNAATGPGAKVNIPWPDVDTLWCKPMIACVIGRSFFQANETEAAEAIAGYTLLTDLSGRKPDAAADMTAWHSLMDSRQFPGACPIGPTIVTRDEFGDPADLPVSVCINDVEVGAGTIWPADRNPGRLLSALSHRFEFRPGDLVALEPGSDSAGVPRELQPGDRFSAGCGDLIELDVTIA
jgi:2-keto-4-pentenoate hydratase/2-oxohepta-3-ene-1,7-dioic acid hydratase in catechol pathway